MYIKNLILITLAVFVFTSCGNEEQEFFDCPELELNIGDDCFIPVPDRPGEELQGTVSENCECVPLVVFDCPELELNFREECIISDTITNEEVIGFVSEECLCVDTNSYDCPELMANIGEECRDQDGNLGRIGENCECVTEQSSEFDCVDLSASFGDICRDEADNLGRINLDCECTIGIINTEVDINKSANINFGRTENTFLNFEIIPLSTGHAVRVQPRSDIQIMDSSTFGYPNALTAGEEISASSDWSTGGNFVLGTSVGNAGNFEGAGIRYLGFRINDDNNYYYGWVELDNNVGNTLLTISNYGINYIAGESIVAGEF